MTFKVKRPFFDKENNLKPYSKGDVYSNDNEDRVAFLVEKGFLMEKRKPPSEYPIHIGGGYYELPNGERVRGKEEAEKLMQGDE